MKIVFRNLPEGEGAVRVSLDGGNTFIDHQINTIRENGIPLADSQDYSKILIKGSANILRNLDILSNVKVDGAAQGTGIPCTYEKPVYGLGTVTYKCYVLDQDSNGERDGLGTLCVYVKNINNKDTFYIYTPWNNNDKPFAEYTNELINAFEYSNNGFYITDIYKQSDNSLVASGSDGSPGRFIPYPTNDLTNEEETVVDTETVTEVIKFIQDPPTVTENGTVTADEGKAFKSANVEVPKSELGFKCFYNYASEYHFESYEEFPIRDNGERNYTLLMSNDYLSRMYKRVFSSHTYNGVVSIQDSWDNSYLHYSTVGQEYNLFNLHTDTEHTTVKLKFYDDLIASERQEAQIEVYLSNGEEYIPAQAMALSTEVPM